MSPRRIAKLVDQAFEKHVLLMRSELDDLDSKYQAALAQVPDGQFIPTLTGWMVARWSVSIEYLRPLMTGAKESLPILEKLIAQGEGKALRFVDAVLENAASPSREQLIARISALLNSVSLAFMSEARLKVFDNTNLEPLTIRRVTPAVKTRRRRLVKAFLKKNDLDMNGLAHRIRYSTDAIKAVIREDRIRFADDGARAGLLSVLKIDVEEWYRE